MASVPDTAAAAPPPGAQAPEERDGEYPRWPLWAPFVAAGLGIAVAVLLVSVIGAALQAAGPKLDEDSPWLTSLTTLGLDVCIVVAIFAVASLTTRPRLWHFGLRPSSLGGALTAMLIAIGVFLGFAFLYDAIFQPENPQRIVEDLGADRSTALLVAGALVVIAVAPVAEELLFRGFLFRTLRARMGFWPAAALDGVMFGLVHGSLVIVPILAVLGVVLCWVYERTGSLYPCIALHVLNNTLAYGATADDGWVAAGAVGAVMLVACILVPAASPARRLRARPSH